MELFKELKTNPTRRDLLEFGLIFLVGMAVIGAINHFGWHVLFLAGKPERAMGFWVAGAVIFVASQLPVIGRLLYIAWMGLGMIIGFFTAPVIMFLVYIVAIVPLGFVFKLMGRDTMKRKLDPHAKSYWEDYPKNDDPASYVKQF
jgi:hypothetical protein